MPEASLYTPSEALGALLSVHYFLNTFAEVLGPEDGFIGLPLRALDAALADGDHPLSQSLQWRNEGVYSARHLTGEQQQALSACLSPSLNPRS